MVGQYNFAHQNSASVITGVKNLDWQTSNGTSLREWLQAVTNSQGKKLFSRIFEPVGAKTVLYHAQEDYSEAVSWRKSAILKIANLISETEIFDDVFMSLAFTNPAWIRQRLLEQQAGIVVVNRLREKYHLVGATVLYKPPPRPITRPTAKKAVFSLQSAPKVPRRRP